MTSPSPVLQFYSAIKIWMSSLKRDQSFLTDWSGHYSGGFKLKLDIQHFNPANFVFLICVKCRDSFHFYQL